MNEIDFFWERVNSLIKRSGMTQHEVSVKCNFNSPRRMQNLSAGKRYPDCLEAVKIAQVLNTTVEFLVTGNDKSMSDDKIKLVSLYEQLNDSVKPIVFDFFYALTKNNNPPTE